MPSSDHQFSINVMVIKPAYVWNATAEAHPAVVTGGIVDVVLKPYFSHNEVVVLLWVANINAGEMMNPAEMRTQLLQSAEWHYQKNGLERRYGSFRSSPIPMRLLFADEYARLMHATFKQIAGAGFDPDNRELWLTAELAPGLNTTLIPRPFTVGTGKYSNTLILWVADITDYGLTGLLAARYKQELGEHLKQHWIKVRAAFKATFEGTIQYRIVFSDEYRTFEGSLYHLARTVGSMGELYYD